MKIKRIKLFDDFLYMKISNSECFFLFAALFGMLSLISYIFNIPAPYFAFPLIILVVYYFVIDKFGEKRFAQPVLCEQRRLDE